MINERLYLNWGNSYIKIEDGVMELKHKPSLILNLGTYISDNEIRDNIENFSLLYFQIIMKRNICMILQHEGMGYKARIEPMVKKEDVDKFIQFREIMNKNGLFQNRSKVDAMYKIKERNEQKKEKEDFHKKLSELPGFYEFWTKKEIYYLQTILFDGEEVLTATSGVMDGNTWLIACTNKRIIFIDKGMVYGAKYSEIMIDKVNAISFKNGMNMGEIHVEDGAKSRIIQNVPNSSTIPFVDAVHKAMELSKSCNTVIHQQAHSVADELLKFKQLLDIGAITEEEYETQKKKMLN